MWLGKLIATMGVDTTALIRAEKDMRRMEARMQASITRINKRLETSGAAMKKFGRSMSMYMTAPLALVGGAAFKMHMSFESSMSKIVGLVGVAHEQVDSWSKDILKIAPELGKAPQELADALFFVTSAGLRGAKAMNVLTMSAKASAAGLGETKIVADLVTSAMNAYGSAVLNAEQATDVLVATVREGKAEAAALTQSMGMVLPIASNMGVAFNEVGAAIAAMTRTGTSAATASMQLRQILASLLKPTEQSKELLEEMGTSAEQVEAGFKAMGTSAAYFRKVIREQGLLSALMEIKDLSAKFGEEAMSTVFPNIRALSGVLDIMGENLEDNIALFKRMGITTDSLKKAFGAAAETAEFKWNVAITTGKTALTTLGKTVSESFLPILKSLTEKVEKITTWFNNLSESQRQTIVRVGGLIAIIGPLTMALGFLVGNVLPGLISLIGKTTVVFRGLTIVMMQNPFIAVAAVVAIATVALVKYIKKAKEASTALDVKAIENATGQIDKLAESMVKLSETQRRAKLVERINFLKENILLSAEETKKWTKALIKADNIIFTSTKKLDYLEAELKLSVETTKSYRKELQLLEKDFWKIVKATDKVEESLVKVKKVLAKPIALVRIPAPVPLVGVGMFEIKTAPGEKLAAQAKLIADAWVKAAEAGKLYDTTITTGLANMETAVEGNIVKWEELNSRMKENQDILIHVGELMEGIGMLGIALIDRRITKLDEQYERDITAAANNAGQKIRIEEAYNKKRNDLLRKAAIAEKAVAVFSIALSTAKGVMDAASKVDTMPLIPWIMALGGIQAAIAMAQPIPQFGEGAIVTKPTLAMIGEKKPEGVFPLDKLKRQPININVTVEGVARGEDIHYIVKEIERKHQNSY